MGVTLVYNLWCWPFIGMVPVIAQKDFALTPALVGALSACDGLGGTIGALAVGLLATTRTLFRFYFFGTLIVSASDAGHGAASDGRQRRSASCS